MRYVAFALLFVPLWVAPHAAAQSAGGGPPPCAPEPYSIETRSSERSPMIGAGGNAITHNGLVTYGVLNTGQKIADLVVIFKSNGTLRPLSFHAEVDTGKRRYRVTPKRLPAAGRFAWSLGPLPNGAVIKTQMTVRFRHANSYQYEDLLYGSLLPDGKPDPASKLSGGGWSSGSGT